MVGFSKNSFDDPRGDMDLKPFRGARYGSYLLALASWASWVKCSQSYRVYKYGWYGKKKNILFKITLSEQQIFE